MRELSNFELVATAGQRVYWRGRLNVRLSRTSRLDLYTVFCGLRITARWNMDGDAPLRGRTGGKFASNGR